MRVAGVEASVGDLLAIVCQRSRARSSALPALAAESETRAKIAVNYREVRFTFY